MAIDRASSLHIINTQYSVFFGVIFGLSFYVNASNPPSVDLSIRAENIPIMLFMSLYYISDWFTANVLPRRIPISIVLLFFQVLGVVFLGVTIVLMNSNGMSKYILFGTYAVLVGIYDLYLQWRLARQCTQTPDASNLPFGLIIASIRIALSAVILVPAAFGAIRPDVAQLLVEGLPLMVYLVVALKIARLIFLNWQLPLTQEANT
jgi:hypothetical protein